MAEEKKENILKVNDELDVAIIQLDELEEEDLDFMVMK